MVGAGLTLAALSLFAKAVGLVGEAVSASWFGAGDAIDAYVIAALVPVSLTGILCGAFQFAFIPAYRKTLDQSGEDEAAHLLAGASLVAVIVLALAMALMIWAMPAYLPLLASGFDQGKRALTERLLVMLAPYVLVNGIGYIWAGVLVARRAFALPALVPAITPAVTIVILALRAGDQGVAALVVGARAGMPIEASLLALGLRRLGVRLLPRWSGIDARLMALGKEYGAM